MASQPYYSLNDLQELGDIENKVFRMLNVSSLTEPFGAENDDMNYASFSSKMMRSGKDEALVRAPEAFYKYV